MTGDSDSVAAGIVIRPMRREDVDGVTLLEQRIFPDPWPRQAFSEELGRSNRGVLVAEIGGVLAGYGCYIVIYGEAQLTNIAVDARFRGKSVAKKLLNRILEIAKAADCENIFLDVRPTNKAAIALYRKYGFIELYRRADYYRSPVEDALVMVRNLREG